jgi:hypothetical protein
MFSARGEALSCRLVLRTGSRLRLEFRESCPSWIEGFLRLRRGMLVQTLARDRVQSRAVWPANRLKRKRQNNGVPDKSFKIHVVVLNLEVIRFLSRIREKLLELDFDALGDRCEASAALSLERRTGRSGGEDSFVDGLETHLDIDRSVRRHRDESLAPALGQVDIEREFAHLAGSTDEVADVEGEGAGSGGSHPTSLAAGA